MAIESTNFFSFLQQTRSPIGLVDEYNLSEIYESDQRDALVNLLLDPNGLDQIAGLSKEGLQKEDLRLIGGLEKPVIDSLAIFDRTDSNVSFDLSTMIRVGDPIGEPGKQSFVSSQFSDNLVVLHGGLAAKNIEYDFIDENGEIRTTSVSTSRESLFNSQVNATSGEYTQALFPGLLRVRRRSHINQLKLNNKLFVEKSTIVESPAAKINIPVYMRTSANTTPAVTALQSYATKNSPFVLPIKVTGGGSFKLGPRVVQSNNYYFGYEIKRKSDLVSVVSKTYDNSKEDPTISVSFNLNGTVGNGVDCFLYIYCVPALIKELDISGLGLKEDAGKDLGLVGFDNLEILNISSNDLSTIPTWLKVNYKTLKQLILKGNSYWNNGIISYFDYQTNPGKRGSANQSIPPLSVTQVLGYSGYKATAAANGETDATGKITDYDGTLSTVVDALDTGKTLTQRKYIDSRKNELSGVASCNFDEANGFRQFIALETLDIGPSFRHNNTDFSKIFPNLRDLIMNRPDDATSPKVAYGLIPRLNNSNLLMSYNIRHQRSLGGSIKYAGSKVNYNSADADNSQFVGQFKMRYWNSDHVGLDANVELCGGICADDGMISSGKIKSNRTDDGEYRYSQVASGEAAEAWSGWLNNLETINIWRNDLAFVIADGQSLNWKKLKNVTTAYNGAHGTDYKIAYNAGLSASASDSVDILNSSSISYISAWHGGWGGRLFSINQAKQLTSLYIGYNWWEGYENGKYVLPDNFAINTENLDEQNQLQNFQLHYLLDGANKGLQFRQTDLLKLGKLRYFELRDSYFTGVLPPFVDETVNTDIIAIYMGNNRFHDISNLGTNKNNRFQTIWAPYQGTGYGGCLLPNYKVVGSNNRLYNVQFYGSLFTNYSGGWDDASKRNKPAFNMLYGDVNAPAGLTQEIATPSQTWTSKDGPGGSQAVSNILEASSSFTISNSIRVGDRVLNSSNDEIATVLQIRNGNPAYIYVSENLNLSGATLKFKRAGQDISQYFSNCTALRYLYLQNCSLTGTIPSFSGNNGSLERIRLQDNLFTTYQVGTLQNITGAAINKTSRPRLREVNLSYNALTKNAIRAIISDAYDIAQFYGNNLNTININLLATKADLESGSFINWLETEIFTEGTPAVPGIPGNPEADPPVPEVPGIPPSPDPLLVKFNQLGSLYPQVRVNLFS